MADVLQSIVDAEINAMVPSARGRRPAQVSIEVARELNGADLDLILNPPVKGITTTPLTKLRHTHHLLARLLAEGRKGVECAAITGYSQSRISILQSDPAFAELVAYYKANIQEVFLDVHARLAALGMDSIEELQARLDADPNAFSHAQLMGLAELCLDRSSAPAKGSPKGGGGGGNVGTQITISFQSPKDNSQIIDVTPEPSGK